MFAKTPALFAKTFAALLLSAPLLGAAQPLVPMPEPRAEHPWVTACEDWDEWDKPAPPFKVFGNTYYVGTCGIAAILITSDEGHVLIDSGTEAGADIVLANIAALGFDAADVKLLLNSHEHFDHVGGMAKLQDATGALVVSSEIGIEVMRSGVAHSEDPQHGMHDPMEPIREGMPYFYDDAHALLEQFGINPIETPGHSPGAMSWTWQACEGEDCRSVVYADSLSAVSRDDYRFTDHPIYLANFRAALETVRELENCDILLTPHPSASNMRVKMASGDLAVQFGFPCDHYARKQRWGLIERLIREEPERTTELLGSIER